MNVDETLPLPLHIASDVHWPLTREHEIGQHFLHFLDSLQSKGGSLILLGDIFDFWFEWREVIPAYWFELFYRLRRLKELGTRVFFICGNHDFHPGDYLEKEVGIELRQEKWEFNAGDKRFHVAHGDGLARRDKGYRLLKRVIRHPLSIWMYTNLLHPDWGITLARWTSYTSRKHRQIDKAAWAEEYFAYASSRFDLGNDYVVLGHLHHPEIRWVGEKAYLNCGDWLNDFTYGYYDGAAIELRHWPV